MPARLSCRIPASWGGGGSASVVVVGRPCLVSDGSAFWLLL